LILDDRSSGNVIAEPS